MATCNGRIDVGRYAIEIKFVHIDRLADAIINQTLYCLSWYNNRLSTAVYNFMQTQKERKPCKIKASAANKRSARRRTRSGGPRTARTGAERRHRTFKPWQGSKKRTIPIWYRSFFKRETGIEAFSPVARVFQRLARGNLATGRGRSVRFTGYYVSLLPKVGEPPQAAVLPPTFET